MKVYVETSVWSMAFADDAPHYREPTEVFFDLCKAGPWEPVTSAVTLDEIKNAREPRRGQLLNLIHDIQPSLLRFSESAAALADEFLRFGVVPPSKPDDAKHVAVAMVEEVSVMVSWNFRHIVNVIKAERFNAVALMHGYVKPLRIVSPLEVLNVE